MGVIENQASKSSIYIFLGIIIGFLNTILFPHFLPAEKKGILDSITSASYLLSSIFTIGLPLVTLRHFPKFRNISKKNYGFLGFSISLTIIGALAGFGFLKFIFNEKFSQEYQTTFYFSLLFFAFLFRLIFSNLDSLIRMNYNTVLGIVSSNIILKIINLISVCLFAFSFIQLKTLLMIFVFGLCSPGLISLFYLIFSPGFGTNIFDFSKRVKTLNLKSDIIKTSIFGLFGTVGGVMVLEIDRIMLLDMMGFKEVGIYATAALFGVIVNVPSRSLRGISAAVISESWKNNDLNNIKDIYKKATLNLQIISGFIFLSILICAPYLYTMMKPEYSLGINIIIYIGFAQFIDALTSVNTDILMSSIYYKFQTYFVFLMAGIVIFLNYILIPTYGMKGAAISTMISWSSINIIRTFFIWFKFKMQPFTKENFKVFILLGLVYTIALFAKKFILFIPAINLILMMTLIIAIYWTIILKTNMSTDLNKKFSKMITRFKQTFKI
ncbi:MAG: polysaccharide biosynthesis C-terminal domain-containing protein [Flavobacteriales bacterium]|nr:polysaccharide biosynthesis C-terminal domain-containing protein [Flavobacteriales bacterium]